MVRLVRVSISSPDRDRGRVGVEPDDGEEDQLFELADRFTHRLPSFWNETHTVGKMRPGCQDRIR